MYQNHVLKIMHFAEADAFVGCILVLSGDENGDGAGPGSVNPGLLDS